MYGGTPGGKQIRKSAAENQQVQPGVDGVASPARTLCSLHPCPALLQCLHLAITRIIIYRKNSSLVTHPFTPLKPRLVLCDSDDGFLLGESQNVSHDCYRSTSIYLVFIS